ncbi:hypothetical protein [Sphingopyxis alaskensis]|jgi:hypothetical protein|uniref:Cytochrome c domain-containing protein n=1 Tax=Sphingopyxis alaskensis (strain DSM 13593 / LMG 18877 / RB2256) TaxID=317655 RepID=Q1GQQ9_SPHAL|nr:hypothetical protein [Sphingopyxis alaskensis]ABF54013.1 hypothetical protein Sala_2304 [Sphingopyxis alaskensis RB2256]MCM3418911.1 hypothetical protein [Sphingopyxis alaskensis]
MLRTGGIVGALALAVPATPAAAPPPFEILRWTAPGAELAALSTQPAACLGSAAVEVQAGEALFNSPRLLGGQAAKAGLSCAGCHVNGRDNAHFLMAGVSDRAGTADVTHSFFGAARGNGRFDPVTIPDLARPGKVSRDPAGGALESFVRDLIVDEFAGREPTPAMLAALAAYVRAIAPCPDGDPPGRRALDDQLRLIDFALRGATGMARRADPVAARALLAAARHQLGLIAERYPAPPFGAERRELLAASRVLADMHDKAANSDGFIAALSAWRAAFEKDLVQRLRRREARSLYNPANLAFVAPQQDNR